MADTGRHHGLLECHLLLGTVRPLPQEHLREMGANTYQGRLAIETHDHVEDPAGGDRPVAGTTSR